jgi:NAD(P)H-nitrite reductase large subunit
MMLDEKYHGSKQRSKMKMAVSGCRIQCGENCIKDLSLYGTETGWTVQVGGMGGIKPRLAEILVEDIPTEDIEDIIEKTLTFYSNNSKRTRLGFFIEKIGIEAFREGVLSQ